MALVDANGKQVLAFEDKIRNLSRVAELTNAVIEIASSNAWRKYRLAPGEESWRAKELDYFLIAHEAAYDDISRVLAYNQEAAKLWEKMDPETDTRSRRSRDVITKEWRSPGGENFRDRATRLGWMKNGKWKAPPVPRRARVRARHHMTQDERGQLNRRQRIPVSRRQELESLAQHLLKKLHDDSERLYVMDLLKKQSPRSKNGRGKMKVAR